MALAIAIGLGMAMVGWEAALDAGAGPGDDPTTGILAEDGKFFINEANTAFIVQE